MRGGSIFRRIIEAALPVLINVLLKKQKFNKTTGDAKRIDDFTGSI